VRRPLAAGGGGGGPAEKCLANCGGGAPTMGGGYGMTTHRGCGMWWCGCAFKMAWIPINRVPAGKKLHGHGFRSVSTPRCEYGFNLKSTDKKLTDNKISYPYLNISKPELTGAMKSNKYKNKSLVFPYFLQLLSPSRFPQPSSLHCSECPASPTVGRHHRLSYCRSSSPSLLQPRLAASRLPVDISHSPECPASPTVGHRPRLSSSPGRPPVIF
jgi:hypothetical protein